MKSMQSINNKLFIEIYKRIVPPFIQNRVSILRNAGGLNTARKKILKDYQSYPQIGNEEIRQVLDYLRNCPLRVFPYRFPDKYKPWKVIVHHDQQKGLRFVVYEEKRIYFKRSWSASTIQAYFNDLLIEQDPDSPHRYLTRDFGVSENDVVADIGAAEGIFAVEVVEKANEVVLFETDTEWIEALEATFEPWMEKVSIVNKFVSDTDTVRNISLDTFCKTEHKTFDFIKADVDGAESALLNGCRNLLSDAKNIKIAICAYHKAGDEERFTEILNSHKLTVSASGGFMIFFHDSDLKEQYLRRGVLRARK